MKAMTTKFALIDDERLTGKEDYPIVGEAVPKDVVGEILQAYKGLRTCWDCIDKARIAERIIGRGIVVMGGSMVVSVDMASSYGYYFNPPYEFHVWLSLGNGSIFDAALPGMILKGANTHDHIGPCLVGRDPVVLAGTPAKWMLYKEVKKYG